MDDENRNRFMLDTSIIIPIAIAGGVALLIICFLYCCRHFVQGKRIFRTSPRPLEGGGTDRSRTAAGRRPTVQRHNGDGLGGSDLLGALQGQFLPWTTREQGYYQRHGHYPPPSTQSRANYNSTQVIYIGTSPSTH